MMKMKIETILPCRIAYIRRIGPYGLSNVETMERLKHWAKATGFLEGESVILGIARENPETTSPQNCRYDTCVVLPKDCRVPDDSVSEDLLDGGKYAVFEISHTAMAVQRAWAGIFPELSARGLKMDAARPILERYASQMVANHRCEICVPIL